MAALTADHADVSAQAHNFPVRAAAGVGLAQANHIAQIELGNLTHRPGLYHAPLVNAKFAPDPLTVL